MNIKYNIISKKKAHSNGVPHTNCGTRELKNKPETFLKVNYNN